ncbi:tRNA 2-selenouridine(34) synthase MnmH [Bacillus sp. HMF5848]|uniref:tRNA 2-selenouridine(34) synthase MnmH n=1 Tax=Bacillus sp. HMF5848 TaxID=2495421 RepID=UPI000F775685|nr:tRNA 2-selenouridine(34) synthase MnmH [Bacillus sp. HMF5848]RSK27250.1 tRNA 2-selenouridine(34) synthase MnmH [Bacillus sp. HMF5848]
MKETLIENVTNTQILIDVRSPDEFKDATIPNAVNIPLFSNDERQTVGTIYKEQGPNQAKWKAMELVSHKIPNILENIRNLANDHDAEPIIFCWRGGMRSKAVTTFASFSGLNVSRLIGGYRAYRNYILNISPSLLPETGIIIHGNTGAGKTELLQLLKDKQQPIIDLESIANHRGSVFGQIGLRKPHNQKMFDGLLFDNLKEISHYKYFIMEAESKRVGHCIQPDYLLKVKQRGLHILLTSPIEERVKRIKNEYIIPYENESWFESTVVQAISIIKKRLGLEIYNDIYNMFVHKQYDDFIELLLTKYYDACYDFKSTEYIDTFIPVDGSNLEIAAKQIQDIILNHVTDSTSIKV